MLNPLKVQASKSARYAIPELGEQLRIVAGLLKLKHFDGIWCSKDLLTVRRFRDHFEVPEYLPWETARRMVEAGEALAAQFGDRPGVELRDSGLRNMDFGCDFPVSGSVPVPALEYKSLPAGELCAVQVYP